MRLLYTLLFVIVTLSSTAQNFTWEVGGGFGTSNYFGDIGGLDFDGNKGPADIMLNTTKYNASLFARRMIDYRFYANFQLTYLQIGGADSFSPNTGRTSRNLDFTNDIIEALAMAEFHPLIINDLGGRRRYVADLHLYVSTGIGIAYSDPRDARGQKLRPLRTEGIGYSNIQAVIPLSTGIFVSFRGRYSGYRVHRIGISVNYRVTFTDYLDDISTVYPDISVFDGRPEALAASYKGYREDNFPNDYPQGSVRGNPKSNDGYLTTMIYYSKRISSGRKNHKLPRRQEFYGRTRRMKTR